MSNIVVTLKQGSWTIDVPHEPCTLRESSFVAPQFGAAHVFYPRHEGRPFERNVSAQVPRFQLHK